MVFVTQKKIPVNIPSRLSYAKCNYADLQALSRVQDKLIDPSSVTHIFKVNLYAY